MENTGNADKDAEIWSDEFFFKFPGTRRLNLFCFLKYYFASEAFQNLKLEKCATQIIEGFTPFDQNFLVDIKMSKIVRLPCI